jgi:hypothetical protein
MRTIFTEDEVKEFLIKLSREIQGEALLLPSKPTMIDPIEVITAMSSPSAYAEMMSKLSQAQGEVMGKLELMKRVLKFFDIEVVEE